MDAMTQPSRQPLSEGSPSDLLKELTRQAHAEMEAQPALAWFHASLADRPAYIHYLGTMHGFYAGLEVRLATCPEPLPEVLGGPSRTQALARDLASLGMPAAHLAELPRCTDLPECRSGAQRAGIAYVINGSTLGGLVLAARVEQQLGTAASDATRFLRLHGTETKARWLAFRSWLDGYLDQRPDRMAQAGAAAMDTFHSLAAWLEMHYQNTAAMDQAS